MKDGAALHPTILIVDPDPVARDRLAAQCATGFDCLMAGSGAEALKALQDHFVEVVLCVTGETAAEGTALLEEIGSHWPETVRIAISRGDDPAPLPADLYQVVTDTLSQSALTRMLRNAAQLFRVRRENDRMSFEMRFLTRKPAASAPANLRPADQGLAFDTILRSPKSPLNGTIAQARILASFEVPILISGAQGTGKLDLARAIHDGSLRGDRPFHALTCNGLTDAQLRHDLIGIRNNGSSKIGLLNKAARGTVFLNGIDTLPVETQSWLARALAEGVVHVPGQPEPQRIDCRVIAGSHRDLRKMQSEGRFSADLYHLVAVGLLSVPALCARQSDIPALAHHILFDASAAHGKAVHGFSNDALQFLCAYDWPGNLPELTNEINRMLIFAQDRTLGPELISRHILQAQKGAQDPVEDAVIACDGPLKARVEDIEKRILREVLTRLKWNKSRAAAELGLSRVGLRAKLDRYGLCPGVIDASDTPGGN
jgi:two-component system response regulator HupR/HoxA